MEQELRNFVIMQFPNFIISDEHTIDNFKNHILVEMLSYHIQDTFRVFYLNNLSDEVVQYMIPDIYDFYINWKNQHHNAELNNNIIIEDISDDNYHSASENTIIEDVDIINISNMFDSEMKLEEQEEYKVHQ